MNPQTEVQESGEVILFNDQFYILATSSLADDRSRVLKEGESFALLDRHGDIQQVGRTQQGLFHEGTRFLSRWVLRLGGERPLYLSSTVKEDNALLSVDLMNPEIFLDGEIAIPGGNVHIQRTKFLWHGAGYERIRVENYGIVPVTAPLRIDFDADFRDIFEVRGMARARRGERHTEVVGRQEVQIIYEGLDHVRRRTRILFASEPAELTPTTVHFVARLNPKESATFPITIVCEVGTQAAAVYAYDTALSASTRTLQHDMAEDCRVETDNDQFNCWLARSYADLHMMITE
ncbi:MAG: glycogen debranching N-terminal domain-containing protein, partial [Candidatus Xenobia bacterium]